MIVHGVDSKHAWKVEWAIPYYSVNIYGQKLVNLNSVSLPHIFINTVKLPLTHVEFNFHPKLGFFPASNKANYLYHLQNTTFNCHVYTIKINSILLILLCFQHTKFVSDLNGLFVPTVLDPKPFNALMKYFQVDLFVRLSSFGPYVLNKWGWDLQA